MSSLVGSFKKAQNIPTAAEADLGFSKDRKKERKVRSANQIKSYANNIKDYTVLQWNGSTKSCFRAQQLSSLDSLNSKKQLLTKLLTAIQY